MKPTSTHTFFDLQGNRLTVEAWVLGSPEGVRSRLICRRSGEAFHAGRWVSHASLSEAETSVAKRLAKANLYWVRGSGRRIHLTPSQAKRFA